VRGDETRWGKLLAGSALIGMARVYPLGKLPNGGRLARIGGTCSGSVPGTCPESVPETFNVTPCKEYVMESEKPAIFEQVREFSNLVKEIEQNTGKSLQYVAFQYLTPEGDIKQSVSLNFEKPNVPH
jgi:hypothetical protein